MSVKAYATDTDRRLREIRMLEKKVVVVDGVARETLVLKSRAGNRDSKGAESGGVASRNSRQVTRKVRGNTDEGVRRRTMAETTDTDDTTRNVLVETVEGWANDVRQVAVLLRNRQDDMALAMMQIAAAKLDGAASRIIEALENERALAEEARDIF